MAIKIKWQLKMLLKVVLSRLPVSYKNWKRLSIFQHGNMEQPEYAYGVFMKHYERMNSRRRKTSFVALEIGPGDSLFSALIGYSYGAKTTYLLDSGRFAADNWNKYIEMLYFLDKKGCNVSALFKCVSLDELLANCSCKYLTNGLESIKNLPEQEVDFIWSHSVLQHIKKDNFREFIKELRRILKDDGICSHRIDLRDMIDGSLNNLRFDERVWESKLMAESGFYTNRLRYSQIIKIFHQCGFSCEVINIERWPELPIPKEQFDRQFRILRDDELTIRGFDVILHAI